MADPVLDEEMIISFLRVPKSCEYVNSLQSGCMQALADLYDRKVTRDEFVQGAAVCVAAYAQCSKLWMLNNVREVFEDGTLTAEKFKDADERMAQILRKHTEVVVELVKRLQECPTSKDPVN